MGRNKEIPMKHLLPLVLIFGLTSLKSEGELPTSDAKPLDPPPQECVQVKGLTASETGVEDFGVAVAISGDTIVSGSSDAAYIFVRSQGGTGNWGQVKSLTVSGAALSEFGQLVALDNDTAVVGAFDAQVGVAPNPKLGAGAAYVFVRDQGGTNGWGQVKEVTASDAAVVAYFGSSVAISGDTVVVGAIGVDDFTGAAYVFVRDQGGTNGWGQVKKLTAVDAAQNARFGHSVAINGNTIVVGANGADSGAGAAYMFVSDQGGTGNWGQLKKLTASDAAVGDSFGVSVTISEHTGTAVVGMGSPLTAARQGAAYIFEADQGGTGNWGQSKRLAASNPSNGDFFGASVALRLDTLVAGASGTNKAYVFRRSQGGTGNWGLVKEITDPGTPATNDEFGSYVAVSNDALVVVGAYGKNSVTGAAYIFNCQVSPM
jgi:hypothetical protein